MLNEIESFVNWMHRRSPEARTWRDYAYDLNQFVATVGDQPPSAITFHDVDGFVLQQVQRGLKPCTVNRRLAAIQAFYAFLADDDPSLLCPVLPHRHMLKERQVPGKEGLGAVDGLGHEPSPLGWWKAVAVAVVSVQSDVSSVVKAPLGDTARAVPYQWRHVIIRACHLTPRHSAAG